jgi:peroxiredoxin Q/BCP
MKTALRLLPLALGAMAMLAGPAAAQDSKEPLKVGDAAPDFTLPATDGKTYSLKQLQGRWVVLAWFPKAFTAGWTAECNSLRESGGLIKKFDTAYFMISVDTLEDNKAFAEKEHADFPMLANPDKKVAFAYGVIPPDRPADRQFANRWTFYIDPTGKIAYIDHAVKPATSGQDIVAKLTELNVPARK